ncbi:MAG: MOSC domain-containing protein [Chloroflexi bacterium]|nr:MOSC domain-containing protein [Chloroflexota bacterium]MDA1219151.1 MOSC domain-containing protein [Chloroflexota bacterium]PKB57156.1 MAG: MOSC domain-containing protein [SAR202 cluster bacterium Casp-Chloro-G3]
MEQIMHQTMTELEAGLDQIRQSPQDSGVLELIVRRPEVGEREVLDAGELSLSDGLSGDSWKARPSSRSADGLAHPDMQLNVMNSRVIALVAQKKERWQLAGDQLFVDLDLSEENLPPGTQLSIGGAIIQVTDQPHTGCKKFSERFGVDALKFVSTPLAKEIKLRGINAKVVQPGAIKPGDTVKKL